MPIQIIGEPSQATQAFANRRSNRMMQAIDQAGELERQTNQLNAQRSIASMQEQGATQRTAMQEAGADRRQQMEIGAQDKQQAAGIKAQLDRDRLLDAQDTRRLMLQRSWKEADDKAKEALARGDKEEYQKYMLETQRLQTAGQIAEMAIMSQSLGGVIKAIQNMNGQETSRAKVEAATETMRKQVGAAARVREDAAGVIGSDITSSKLGDVGSTATLDQVVQDTTSKMGSPISLDLFADPVKLESWAKKASPVEYAVAKTVLEQAKARLTEVDKTASKQGTYRAAPKAGPMGSWTLGSEKTAPSQSENIQGSLARIEAAEAALRRLQFSDSKTDDGRRLGDYVTSLDMAYNGNTAGAMVVGAFDQAQGDPDAMRKILMPSNGMGGIDWTNPAFSKFAADPAMRQMVDQMVAPYFQVLSSGTGPDLGAQSAQQATGGMGAYGDFMRR